MEDEHMGHESETLSFRRSETHFPYQGVGPLSFPVFDPSDVDVDIVQCFSC
jgi:hypothetical protein